MAASSTRRSKVRGLLENFRERCGHGQDSCKICELSWEFTIDQSVGFRVTKPIVQCDKTSGLMVSSLALNTSRSLAGM